MHIEKGLDTIQMKLCNRPFPSCYCEVKETDKTYKVKIVCYGMVMRKYTIKKGKLTDNLISVINNRNSSDWRSTRYVVER